jgi:mono/diheme cytochrome c family protein
MPGHQMQGAVIVDEPQPAATVEPDVSVGRALYERHCAGCHGAQGRGDGPEAPFLSPRPGSLVSAGTSAKPDADLLAIIAEGKPHTAMRGYRDMLNENERRDVLLYIRSLVRFHPPPPPAPPPSPAEPRDR